MRSGSIERERAVFHSSPPRYALLRHCAVLYLVMMPVPLSRSGRSALLLVLRLLVACLALFAASVCLLICAVEHQLLLLLDVLVLLVFVLLRIIIVSLALVLNLVVDQVVEGGDGAY
jgi:hypothetical protein